MGCYMSLSRTDWLGSVLANDALIEICKNLTAKELRELARTCQYIFRITSERFSYSHYGLGARYLASLQRQLAAATEETEVLMDSVVFGPSLTDVLLSRKALLVYFSVASACAYLYLNFPRLANGEIATLPKILQLEDLQQRARLLRQVYKGFSVAMLSALSTFIMCGLIMVDFCRASQQSLEGLSRGVSSATQHKLQAIINKYSLIYCYADSLAHEISTGLLPTANIYLPSYVQSDVLVLKEQIIPLLQQQLKKIIGTNRKLSLQELPEAVTVTVEKADRVVDFKAWCTSSIVFYNNNVATKKLAITCDDLPEVTVEESIEHRL